MPQEPTAVPFTPRVPLSRKAVLHSAMPDRSASLRATAGVRLRAAVADRQELHLYLCDETVA